MTIPCENINVKAPIYACNNGSDFKSSTISSLFIICVLDVSFLDTLFGKKNRDTIVPRAIKIEIVIKTHSTPTTFQTPADEATVTAPTITGVTGNSTAGYEVKGTADANATVEIRNAGGTVIGTGTADELPVTPVIVGAVTVASSAGVWNVVGVEWVFITISILMALGTIVSLFFLPNNVSRKDTSRTQMMNKEDMVELLKSEPLLQAYIGAFTLMFSQGIVTYMLPVKVEALALKAGPTIAAVPTAAPDRAIAFPCLFAFVCFDKNVKAAGIKKPSLNPCIKRTTNSCSPL